MDLSGGTEYQIFPAAALLVCNLLCTGEGTDDVKAISRCNARRHLLYRVYNEHFRRVLWGEPPIFFTADGKAVGPPEWKLAQVRNRILAQLAQPRRLLPPHGAHPYVRGSRD